MAWRWRRAVLGGAVLGVVTAGCGGGDATPTAETSSGGPSSSTSSSGDPGSTTSGTTASADGTTTALATSSGSEDSGPGTSSSSGAADTSSSGDTTEGTTGEPIDCDALPQGPLPYTIKVGPRTSEDLAFDDLGNVVGAQEGNLFLSPFDDDPSLWVPGAGGFIAGLRATSTGMIVYADVSSATLFRIAGGVKEPILGGLEYPNGMDVDLDGFIYVAEQSASRVRRVDPVTGEFTIVAEDLDNANGVSFSPDYQTLYVGSFGGGTITAVHLNPDMSTDSVELFRSGIGSGALDGMAVDACGNVYVCEFGPATVWRISPDGATIAPLVELGADTGWIPNLQWGSGIGGWDRETLYVVDFSADRLFEVQVGVTDKPRSYP